MADCIYKFNTLWKRTFAFNLSSAPLWWFFLLSRVTEPIRRLSKGGAGLLLGLACVVISIGNVEDLLHCLGLQDFS